jgi:hypothetical protein
MILMYNSLLDTSISIATSSNKASYRQDSNIMDSTHEEDKTNRFSSNLPTNLWVFESLIYEACPSPVLIRSQIFYFSSLMTEDLSLYLLLPPFGRFYWETNTFLTSIEQLRFFICLYQQLLRMNSRQFYYGRTGWSCYWYYFSWFFWRRQFYGDSLNLSIFFLSYFWNFIFRDTIQNTYLVFSSSRNVDPIVACLFIWFIILFGPVIDFRALRPFTNIE